LIFYQRSQERLRFVVVVTNCDQAMRPERFEHGDSGVYGSCPGWGLRHGLLGRQSAGQEKYQHQHSSFHADPE
jgi:hypothetical protein